eukprot:15465205-Alexandrium_andersonii.AAC.1
MQVLHDSARPWSVAGFSNNFCSDGCGSQRRFHPAGIERYHNHSQRHSRPRGADRVPELPLEHGQG